MILQYYNRILKLEKFVQLNTSYKFTSATIWPMALHLNMHYPFSTILCRVSAGSAHYNTSKRAPAPARRPTSAMADNATD